MADLPARLRASTGFKSFIAGDGGRSICADTDLMVEAADRIDELGRVLSMIAHCDDADHPDFEPHGLYRSMMVGMARNVLGVEQDHSGGLKGPWLARCGHCQAPCIICTPVVPVVLPEYEDDDD